MKNYLKISDQKRISLILLYIFSTLFLPLFAQNESELLVSTGNRIDKIELFRYDVTTARHFSFGTWDNRQHLFLRISSGKYEGWSEVLAATNTPDFNPLEWGAYLKDYKGLEINQAYNLLKKNQVTGSKMSNKQMELLEMSLLDLIGRIKGKSVNELLGLTHYKAVPGLFCVLDDTAEGVQKSIQSGLEQGFNSHFKIKMFGKKELDILLLQTAKSMLSRNSIVISDANGGYKGWKNIEELAGVLSDFHLNGLYGMEDPAKMNIEQWKELQQKVGKLNLIPDEPIRPSWKGFETVQKNMGRIFNLHPCAMGSIIYMAKTAQKIKKFGGKIMIGDASFVGPGCSQWRQIAIGAGAEWVEAIDKVGDSDNYLNCVMNEPTYRDKKGHFTMKPKSGFGIEIDTEKLKKNCNAYFEL